MPADFIRLIKWCFPVARLAGLDSGRQRLVRTFLFHRTIYASLCIVPLSGYFLVLLSTSEEQNLACVPLGEWMKCLFIDLRLAINTRSEKQAFLYESSRSRGTNFRESIAAIDFSTMIIKIGCSETSYASLRIRFYFWLSTNIHTHTYTHKLFYSIGPSMPSREYLRTWHNAQYNVENYFNFLLSQLEAITYRLFCKGSFPVLFYHIGYL